MNAFKPNPSLIPRFNIDYNTKDFLSALIHFNTTPDVTPITRIFPNACISYTNSGRTSLYIILKALQLPEHSNIGVPLYTCPSVFDAILHAGHTPVFLDIDPDNYTLSPEHLAEKIDALDAVVAVHTFGRPAHMDEILKIAGDKPLIEDCAHALLSRYKGRLCGTIATAGFFSFRSGKYISAGEGGVIVTKDSQLATKIEEIIEQLPQPTLINEIKHTLATYARSTLYHKPWFGLISLPLGSKLEDRVDLMNKYTFNTTRIRKTDLHTITNKIKNFKEKVEMQRENSQYLIEQLSNCDLKLPLEAPDTYCNYYLFPIQLQNKNQRDRLSEKLRAQGVDTAKLFSNTPQIAKQHYRYKGDCPNTEQVAEKILTIPNHYTLKKKELDKLISAVKGGS